MGVPPLCANGPDWIPMAGNDRQADGAFAPAVHGMQDRPDDGEGWRCAACVRDAIAAADGGRA